VWWIWAVVHGFVGELLGVGDCVCVCVCACVRLSVCDREV